MLAREDQRLKTPDKARRILHLSYRFVAMGTVVAVTWWLTSPAFAVDGVSAGPVDRVELARLAPLDTEDLADRTGGTSLPLSGVENTKMGRTAVILWDESKRAKPGGLKSPPGVQFTLKVNGKTF